MFVTLAIQKHPSMVTPGCYNTPGCHNLSPGILPCFIVVLWTSYNFGRLQHQHPGAQGMNPPLRSPCYGCYSCMGCRLDDGDLKQTVIVAFGAEDEDMKLQGIQST